MAPTLVCTWCGEPKAVEEFDRRICRPCVEERKAARAERLRMVRRRGPVDVVEYMSDPYRPAVWGSGQ